MDSANKHGILLEVVQILTDLNFIITKAYICSDGGWFMDGKDIYLFVSLDLSIFAKDFEGEINDELSYVGSIQCYQSRWKQDYRRTYLGLYHEGELWSVCNFGNFLFTSI